MKKLLALLCGILLLCAACAPVPSESTPDTSATATIVTTPTTAPTTERTIAEYFRTAVTCTTENYVETVRSFADDPNLLSKTFHGVEYTVNFRLIDPLYQQWLVDRFAAVPLLPEGWEFIDIKIHTGGVTEFVAGRGGEKEFSILCGAYKGDGEEHSYRYWGPIDIRIDKETAQMLQTSDGRSFAYQAGIAAGEVDGYTWCVQRENSYTPTISVDEFTQALSFEKIEL